MQLKIDINKEPLVDYVYKILTSVPMSRDSDLWLYYCILKSKGYNPHKLDFCRLMNLIQKNELPPIESVGRARRKIQNLHPDLRGLYYKDRKKFAEEVREDLSNLISKEF